MSYYKKALALASLALLASCGEDRAEPSLDASDAGSEEATQIVDSYNLDDCGRKVQRQYEKSPYAVLNLWYSATEQDYVATAGSQWQGCPGSQRPAADGKNTTYVLQKSLGLIFRPDLPPPPETVMLYTVPSTRTVNTKTVYEYKPYWYAPRTDSVTPPPANARFEGYMYPLDWRPPPGDPRFVPLYYQTTSGDSRLDTTGTVVYGYGISEAAAAVLPAGRCRNDADCAVSELCQITAGDPAASDGTTGTCRPACVSSLDCKDPDASSCDYASRHCVDPIVRYDSLDAKFSRASKASYQVGASELVWAQPNELRREDVGDGYGPIPLFEGASENLLTYSNDLTGAQWNKSGVTSFVSPDSPGPHDSTEIVATSANNGGSSIYVNSGLPALAANEESVLTFWSRGATAEGDNYRYRTMYTTNNGSWLTAYFYTPSTPLWSRATSVMTTRTGTPQSLSFHASSAVGVPVRAYDSRRIAYVQIERGRIGTSVIYTDGTTATRAADRMSIQTSDDRMRSALRVYVSPAFDLQDMPADSNQTILAVGNFTNTVTPRLGWALQLSRVSTNSPRIRVIDNTGTELGGRFVSCRRNKYLTIDISLANRTVLVEGDTTSSFSLGANALAVTLPATISVGHRHDGTTPFFGRISEILPLPAGADTRGPNFSSLVVTPSRDFESDINVDYVLGEYGTVEASISRGATVDKASVGYGTGGTFLLSGFATPGVVNQVTFKVTDARGNATTSRTMEVIPTGEPPRVPKSSWTHVRGDAYALTTRFAFDLSGNDNDLNSTTTSTWPYRTVEYIGSEYWSALDFDGTRVRMNFTKNSAAASQSTLFAVVRPKQLALAQPIWVMPDAELAIDAQNRITWTTGATTTVGPAVALNAISVIAVRMNAAAGLCQLWVNGSVTTCTAPASVTLGGSVGYKASNNTYLKAAVFELAASTQALSDADFADVMTYLEHRYHNLDLLRNGTMNGGVTSLASWSVLGYGASPQYEFLAGFGRRGEGAARLQASHLAENGSVVFYQQVSNATANALHDVAIWAKSQVPGAEITLFVGPTSDPAQAWFATTARTGMAWSEVRARGTVPSANAIVGVALRTKDRVWFDDAYFSRTIH